MNQYYYMNEQGQQIGPMDLASLKFAGLKPDTLVWHSGLPTWLAAKDIPELSNLITPTPPPYQDANRYAGNGPQIRINTNPTPQMSPQGMTKPQNWLWLSICTTLLCCLPIGIVSIIYSSKVDSSWNQGNYQGAIESSDKAKMWALIGVGAGFLWCILMFILALAG